jgi:hypothetical protein
MAKSRVIMELTGDQAKLLQSLDRTIAKQDKMIQKLRETKRGGQEAATSAGKFADSMDKISANPLKAVAGVLQGAGGVSLANAFQGLIRYAAEAREEIKGVADALKESYEAQRDLWQLADSQAAYEKMTQRERAVMRISGADRVAAGQTLFNLTSLSREAAFEDILRSRAFMDPKVAGGYFTTVSSDTGWGEGIGTAPEVLSGLLQAAKMSKYNTAETASWAVKNVPMWSAAGSSLGTMLGVGAAISTATTSPENQGTIMTNLDKVIRQWRAEGLAYKEGDRPKPPEAPEWDPPEEPTWSTPQAAARGKPKFDKRLREYREDFVEAEKSYEQIRARYMTRDLPEYEKLETEAKKRFQLAQRSVGQDPLESFALMVQDSARYQELVTSNVRFGQGATALVSRIDLARQYGAEIDAQGKSDAFYQRKATQLPAELIRLQSLDKAAQYRELALEDSAIMEQQGEIMEVYAQGLRADRGGNRVMSMIEGGRLDMIGFGSSEMYRAHAGQFLASEIRGRDPQLFTKHLGPYYDAVPGGGLIDRDDKFTPEQFSALLAAIMEIVEQVNAREAEAADALEKIEQNTRRAADAADPTAPATVPRRALVPPAQPPAPLAAPASTGP